MKAQAGDLGVTGYVTQGFAEGSIGYVNYSYAIGSRFPVAKVLNKAGYYTEPSPTNVSVSLLKARINTDAGSPNYLTQILDDVYNDTDPRNYQLSSYSYFILPTAIRGQFNAAKGRTLGAFTYYAMCQAQQQSASLGYSPLPINLVTSSLEQIRKIPGVEVQSVDVKSCNNPTFSPDGTNLLAKNAPFPSECDKINVTQCAVGTGGAAGQPTATNAGAGPANGASGAGTGAVGAEAAASATAASGADCDPATEDCSVVNSAGGTNSLASAIPVSLAAPGGWTSSQTLTLLVVLLLAVVIVGPAIGIQYFSKRNQK
jgi:phosphate transport system substrate-binding protein